MTLPPVPHFPKIDTLNRDNFFSWSIQLRSALIIHGLEDYLDRVNPVTVAIAGSAEILALNRRYVRGFLLGHVSTELYSIAHSAGSNPADIFESLSGFCTNRTVEGINRLKSQISSAKASNFSCYADYLSHMDRLFGQLIMMGERITDGEKVAQTLGGLPETLQWFKTFSASDSRPDYPIFCRRLLDNTDHKGKGSSTSTSTAYHTGPNKFTKFKKYSKNNNFGNKSNSKRCYTCNGIGHYARDCANHKQKLKGIMKFKRTFNKQFRGRSCACVHEEKCENHAEPLTVFSDDSSDESDYIYSDCSSSDDEQITVGTAYAALSSDNILLDSGSS